MIQTIQRHFNNTKKWVVADWQANPWRLAAETYNAFTALATALIFAQI